MTRELAAYLEMDTSQALEQWRRILARKPQPRQEAFLPVETLLCHGLFYVVNPHSFGGANIHKAPAVVHTLAATFQRTPGSVFSKMLNLDGSRKNCARMEPELFNRLSQNSDHYLVMYRVILEASRQAGLSSAQVPDYLDAGGAQDIPLLGQDELGSDEINLALEESREWIGSRAQAFDFSEEETVRLVEQKARIGQHRFALEVLHTYKHRCGFCGFSAGQLKRHGLIIASHIKPWKDSSNRERLDSRNGVAACPIHDKAFDGGLLTVNGGLRLHRAPIVESQVEQDEGYERFFGEAGLHRRLVLPTAAEPPAPRYLRWHRQHIFQK